MALPDLRVIAIGNPGAGKSTILNSLAGELLFKSGISIGEGLTYQLDERENKRGIFFDTPGLADDTHREAAGKAISTALRKGGPYRVLFFMRTESGRIVREDITTLKLVLDAAPEIGKQYAIVANKLPREVAILLERPGQADKFLTKMFIGIPEERRCPQSNMFYLPVLQEADCQDDYLVELEKLKTIHDTPFTDFVYGEMPVVNLTVGLAKDVASNDFDKNDKILEALLRKIEEDKMWFNEQKRLMCHQMEKAEQEKEEYRKMMFNQQMKMMQQTEDGFDAKLKLQNVTLARGHEKEIHQMNMTEQERLRKKAEDKKKCTIS